MSKTGIIEVFEQLSNYQISKKIVFLKLLFHAHMGNLQENLHNTMHKPVEGEEELTSPCSVLSITSSKESVAR